MSDGQLTTYLYYHSDLTTPIGGANSNAIEAGSSALTNAVGSGYVVLPKGEALADAAEPGMVIRVTMADSQAAGGSVTVALFEVKDISQEATPDPRRYVRISGPDTMNGLVRNMIETATIDDGASGLCTDAPDQIITSYAPAAWAISWVGGLTTTLGAYIRAVEISTFKALLTVAAQTGEFFVLDPDNDRTLIWQKAYNSANAAFILQSEGTETEILKFSKRTAPGGSGASRLFVYGAGSGNNRFTIADAFSGGVPKTGVNLQGMTATPASSYLTNTTLETAGYPVTWESRQWPDIEPSDWEDATASEAAAIALVNAAALYLKNLSDATDAMTREMLVIEAIIHDTVRPMTRTRVIYSDHQYTIDDYFTILDVQHRTENGLRITRLTMNATGRQDVWSGPVKAAIKLDELATNITRGNTAGGAPAAENPTDHGLLDGLSDDDHPQYIKKAGDTGIGTLSMNVGATVDGVDISAHAADPDAHHARLHTLDSASDHSGTLSWAKVNTTGSSLTDIDTRLHSDLQGVGANDHHNQLHDLDSVTDHSGTLSWANVNKTGSSLADLSTRNHSDLQNVSANQHHNQVHGIVSSDHTVTGSTMDVIGLIAANSLGVLTPSSNPGAASALLKSDASGNLSLQDVNVVNLIASADLTAVNTTLSGNIAVNGGGITATTVLDISTTAGNLSLSPAGGYLLVIGEDMQSSNYVADTTGWSLTHATGILEVRSLTADAGIISGALDVGQDFTVGLNVLFVDESQSNVGINCAPDPQFALDIAGNVRWQGYGIGKMAMTVPDAIMICHYDGPRPWETDTTGTVTGHMGQVGTAGGGVIFRQGKYGKAVQIAEATTNLFKDPLATATTKWPSNYTYVTSSTDTSKFYVGISSIKLTVNSTSATLIQGACSDIAISDATAAHTFSVYINFDDLAGITGSSSVKLMPRWVGGVNSAANGTVVTVISDMTAVSGWKRVFLTATPDYTDRTSAVFYILVYNTSHTTGDYIHVDGGQVEQKTYATPLCAGSMGDGHAWTGTAHSSTSTRTAATLTYDSNVIANEGSIGFWWQPANDVTTQPSSYLFANGTLECYFDSATDSIEFTDQTYTASSGALSFSAGDWIHVVCTYEASGIALYIDGAALDTSSYVGGTFSTLEIGGISSTYYGNGLFDDLLTVDRVMPEDEIRALYESNAPVFAETSTYQWQMPNGLGWMDSEGFFMRDADGNAIFGIIGVDGKSWAGISNDAGDLVIGNSGSDYIRWNADVGTLTIAGNGGGITNINGGNIQTGTVTATQITVTTLSALSADMGTLTAGTVTGATIRTAASGARVEMNSTHIFGTNGTTTQWEAVSSTGKLLAGAGNVQLDAAGVTLIDSRQLLFEQNSAIIGEMGTTETGSVRLVVTGGIGSNLTTDSGMATGADWNNSGDGTDSYNQTYGGKTCGRYYLSMQPPTDAVNWYSDWFTISGDGAILRFWFAGAGENPETPASVEWDTGSEDFDTYITDDGVWRYYEFFSKKPSGASTVRLRFYQAYSGLDYLIDHYITGFEVFSYSDEYAFMDAKNDGYVTLQAQNGIKVRPGIVFSKPLYADIEPTLAKAGDMAEFIHYSGTNYYKVISWRYNSTTVYYKYMQLNTTGSPTWTHATSLP